MVTHAGIPRFPEKSLVYYSTNMYMYGGQCGLGYSKNLLYNSDSPWNRGKNEVKILYKYCLIVNGGNFLILYIYNYLNIIIFIFFINISSASISGISRCLISLVSILIMALK